MDLFQLQKISELKFQQSERAVSKLRTREASLRTELTRLQDLAHETHCQPASDTELRAIGGDIIWLKWLSDSRRRLNIELAQVLAQKELVMAQHKKANGKKAVSDTLHEQQLQDQRKQKTAYALDQAINTALVRQAFNSPGARSR